MVGCDGSQATMHAQFRDLMALRVVFSCRSARSIQLSCTDPTVVLQLSCFVTVLRLVALILGSNDGNSGARCGGGI